MARKNPESYRMISTALSQDAAAALDAITREEDRTVRSAIERALMLYAAKMAEASK